MDHCASVLLAFPPASELTDNEQYHKAVRLHIQKVDQLIKDNAATFPNYAEQLLEVIHPAEHSISYLALLSTLLARENTTNPALIEPLTRFLMTFDARQIRYVGGALSAILTAVSNGRVFPPSIAVDLLATALLRIDPTGSIMTSHHLALANLAYSSDNIDPALPVLEKTIVFYPRAKANLSHCYPCDLTLSPVSYITYDSGLTPVKITTTMVLQYDLLCGICFTQKRRWQQAFDALERVVTYPTKDNGCSKIMVEAHNKWLLVGLLLTGKIPVLPDITMPGLQKAYGTLGKPYASLCKAFEEGTSTTSGGTSDSTSANTNNKAEALKSEVESLGNQFWAQDGNLGLVRLVVAHYQRWQILNLREVYAKISLEQIRRRTQSAETGQPLGSEAEVAALVRSMMDEGMLRGARVEPADGDKPAHLVFLEEEGLSEAEFAARMLETARRIKGLGPVIKATNERLATSQDYLKYIVREKKREAGGGGGHGPGGLGAAFAQQIDDEDLMTGVIAGI